MTENEPLPIAQGANDESGCCGCGCLGLLLGGMFGSGCLGAMGALLTGCIAGCGYLILGAIVLFFIGVIFFPHQVWLIITFMPTIIIVLQYLNRQKNPHYKSLEAKVSASLGLKPTTDPTMAALYSFMLWLIIQGSTLVIMWLLFPQHG